MVAYTYRMPVGVPGTATRVEHADVEPQYYDTTNFFASYGIPAVIDATSKKMRPVLAGDAAAAVYGILLRPYPSGNTQDALGVSTPPQGTAYAPAAVANILVRGYCVVQLNATTAAAKGGSVYVRVGAAATGKPIGGIEAAADSTNTILLTNAQFMGPADASGNVEIRYNI